MGRRGARIAVLVAAGVLLPAFTPGLAPGRPRLPACSVPCACDQPPPAPCPPDPECMPLDQGEVCPPHRNDPTEQCMAPDGQGGQLPLDCDAANPDTFSKTARKNVLLVIADDQAYCHYGFMSGQCSGSGQLCWSEKDCGSGHCVTTRECSDSPGTACTSDLDCGGTGFCRAPPGQPLRLNELTCRNRQPAHPKGDEFCADPRDDDGKGAKDHFHYDRTKFPCGDTTTAALAPPRTPYLDDLAAGGRSFRGRT